MVSIFFYICVHFYITVCSFVCVNMSFSSISDMKSEERTFEQQ